MEEQCDQTYVDDACLLQQESLYFAIAHFPHVCFVYEDVCCEQSSLVFLLVNCFLRCRNHLHHVPMTPMPAWKKMIERCHRWQGLERFTLLLG